MKKNILLLLTTCLFFSADAAETQEWCAEDSCCIEDNCCGGSFYAKVFGGANFLQNTTASGNKAKYHPGYIVAGSIGYCSSWGVCLEGEFAFRRNGIKKIHFIGEGSSHHGHFRTFSYMANLLWDIPSCLCWNIHPFIGAGVGYDCQKMHSSNSRIVFNQKWHHCSWQVMAGLAYPIFCNTDITLEYKFHEGGHHFKNHSVGVGLAYKF